MGKIKLMLSDFSRLFYVHDMVVDYSLDSRRLYSLGGRRLYNLDGHRLQPSGRRP